MTIMGLSASAPHASGKTGVSLPLHGHSPRWFEVLRFFRTRRTKGVGILFRLSGQGVTETRARIHPAWKSWFPWSLKGGGRKPNRHRP